jgi:hypothetical protein
LRTTKPQSDTPKVGALFEIRPSDAFAVFIFELKAQAARVMVDDELQRARIIEMLEELEEHLVTKGWADFPLSLPQTRFGRIGDAIRRELEQALYDRMAQ